MSSASVASVVAPPSPAMSSKPPRRLAMSPDGERLALERGDDADDVDVALRAR